MKNWKIDLRMSNSINYFRFNEKEIKMDISSTRLQDPP